GGGGSGDGWFEILRLVFELLRLCVYYPAIGLPIVGAILAFVIYQAIQNHRNKDWNSGPPVPLAASASAAPIAALDPDFSWVVFEDFAFRLFATAHGARGTPQLDALAPYVAEGARAMLAQREPQGATVSRVIVGAQRIARVEPEGNAQQRIVVEYEANYTTLTKAGEARTWYTVEQWTFARAAGARSKPPRAGRDFPCPNCGAPWQSVDAGGAQVCAYCNEVVDNGRFDWTVDAIALRHADPRPPTVTNEVPERGDDVPTYTSATLSRDWQSLANADPAVTKDVLVQRGRLIYDALTAAWATNDLKPARGFLSDGLYDYLGYWIETYRAQGLRNELVDMRITRTSLVKVTRDRYFDAVTLRIWATGKDYVVDRSGKTVRGSRNRERAYSEYWTFIRSAARRGPVVTTSACSNCGAPLAVAMTGACEHCGVHLTGGEFDWVLSKIEQDDTYRG
ncbi:MAG: TIM44-like domain-containing protein, partial [Deltaproteobacteria bacterium]|nr:TIM44-like domain-containing protein [Deltaproteobacteria bacterium]